MAFTSGMTAFRRIAPLAALGSLALALTGCTLGTIATSNGGGSIAAHVSGLGGKIMGGEQPIKGATVAMYTVGTTGYGTGAAAISGATTTTDMYGNFSIPNFTCPVSNSVGSNGTDPLTYIVATGGNPGLGLVATVTGETVTGSAGAYTDTFTGPNNFYIGESVVFSGFTTFSYLNGTQTITAVTGNQGGNSTFSIADASASNPGAAAYTDTGLVSGKSSTNSNIKLVAPTGPCSMSGSVNLDLDEVTTAATAVALAQFINPATGQIGAPNTTLAQTGILNAVSTIANLVNSAGQAVSSFTSTNNGFTITGTPEATKLNTIADLLAACVNSAGYGGSNDTTSNCSVLFSNTGAATNPNDTFAAAADIAQNPASNYTNITNLYKLVTPQSPFAAVGTQPNDWSVGIAYTDTTTATPVIPEAQNIAIDGSGNVFILSTGSSVNGGFGEISPTGTPMVGLSSANTVGTTTSVSMTANNPRNIAIDQSGNVFFGTTTNGYIWEYNAASSTLSNISLPSPSSPYGLAIDGQGNVFFGRASTSTGNTYDFTELVNTAYSNGSYNGGVNIGSGVFSTINYPQYTGTGTTNLVNPQYLAFDPNGTLWMDSGNAITGNTSVYALSNITPCTLSTTIPTVPTATVPAPATSCDATLSTTQNVYTGYTGSSYGTPNLPYGLAGAGNGTAANNGIWFANQTGTDLTLLNVSSTGTVTNPTGSPFGTSSYETKPFYVAVDGAGNVWAPNSGSSAGAGVVEFSATGALLSPYQEGSATVRGFAHAGMASPTGIGIDPSGNVWMANKTTTNHSVFEIVGAAAPTITPISAGLGSKIGTKP
jgi:hypothetical protein